MILGALAIFLGTYLNGTNNDNGKELAEKTSQTNSDAKKKADEQAEKDRKNKEEDDKSTKSSDEDKQSSDDSDKSSNSSNDDSNSNNDNSDSNENASDDASNNNQASQPDQNSDQNVIKTVKIQIQAMMMFKMQLIMQRTIRMGKMGKTPKITKTISLIKVKAKNLIL